MTSYNVERFKVKVKAYYIMYIILLYIVPRDCPEKMVYNSEMDKCNHKAPELMNYTDGEVYCKTIHPAAFLVDLLSAQEQAIINGLAG